MKILNAKKLKKLLTTLKYLISYEAKSQFVTV